MTKEELIRTLDDWNIPRSMFCFEGLPCDCFCIEKTGSGESQQWEIYYYERGRKYDSVFFDSEEDAYDHLYEIAEKLRKIFEPRS